MAEFKTVAESFVTFYYQTFDTNRNALVPLYRDLSMMSWESQETQGAVNIVSKLVSLPFQKVSHKVATLDAQPLGTDGIVISVTGQLLIDDETNPQFYTQTFVLKAEGGNYYVSNDIFRLIYA